MSDTPEPQLTCPTCNARQVWSDTCRRCKCDLSLVHGVLRAADAWRTKTLLALRDGRLEEALESARHYRALLDGEEPVRLLAVCHLLLGHYDTALSLGDPFRPRR